jgi:hypothetical protein
MQARVADDPADPFEIGYARSQLHLLFQELIAERRRIRALVDKARDRNPDDQRIGRAEACGKVVDDRVVVWLARWQPPEPPN